MNKPKQRTTPRAQTLLEDEAVNITKALIRRAVRGNIDALRICMERLVPACRERELSVQLPAGGSAVHVAGAFQVVLNALSDGQLTVTEGQKLSTILENQRKAIETGELEERIISLESDLESNSTRTTIPCQPDLRNLPTALTD